MAIGIDNKNSVYARLQEQAIQFNDEVIRPMVQQMDAEQHFPAAIYKQLAERGFFGTTIPSSLGGQGLDCFAYVTLMEELSRGYVCVADQCGRIELVSTLLASYGTESQQAAYLSQVLSGDLQVSYALTELEAGSDVASIKTTATKTDSGWSLSGGKMWISNAPIADVACVLVSTDPEQGHRGLSFFIVDLHADGVTRTERVDKMGQRANQAGGFNFDNVQLPDDALLGELNRGFYMAMQVLDKGRVGVGAFAVGMAQAGLEAALEHTQTRHQFGKPLFENQGLQWMLADMATDIAAARALVQRGARMIDRGEDASSACSMAKCFASDMAVKQITNAVQLFGARGYMRGAEVERLYRDAKATQIYEGTNQIQRTIIARNLAKHGAVGNR